MSVSVYRINQRDIMNYFVFYICIICNIYIAIELCCINSSPTLRVGLVV